MRLALGLLALCCALPAGAQSCRPVEIATLPVERAGGMIGVAGLVGRQPALLAIDTGADRSLLDAGLATAIGLKPQRAPQPLLAGADGTVFRDFAVVQVVGFGGANQGPVRFVLAPDWHPPDHRIRGLVGMDILGTWDIELDLAQGRMALDQPVRCPGVIPAFARPTHAVAMAPGATRVVVPVVLDGRALQALVDTGASRTSLPLDLADRLFGLRPGWPGVEAAGDTATPNGGRLATYRHRFHLLSLAGLRLDDVDVALIDRPSDPRLGAVHDLVLGLDALSGLKLYFANGQRRLYFASAGD